MSSKFEKNKVMEKEIIRRSLLSIKITESSKNLISILLKYLNSILNFLSNKMASHQSYEKKEIEFLIGLITKLTIRLDKTVKTKYYENDSIPLILGKKYKDKKFMKQMDNPLIYSALEEIVSIPELFPKKVTKILDNIILEHMKYDKLLLLNFTVSKLVAFLYENSRNWNRKNFIERFFIETGEESNKIFWSGLKIYLEEYVNTLLLLKKLCYDKLNEDSITPKKLDLRKSSKRLMMLTEPYRRSMMKKYDSMSHYLKLEERMKYIANENDNQKQNNSKEISSSLIEMSRRGKKSSVIFILKKFRIGRLLILIRKN